MPTLRTARVVLVCGALTASACSSSADRTDAAASADSGDAAMELGARDVLADLGSADVAVDQGAPADTGTDAGFDLGAPTDVAGDTGTDAPGATMDARTDVVTDTGTDVVTDTVTDTATDAVTVTPGVVRLIGPLSGSVVSVPAPTLEWTADMATGTRVDVCADRACATAMMTLDVASGTSVQASRLTPGRTYFWRARSTVGASVGPQSAVWEFEVAQQPPPSDPLRVDTYGGTIPDVNGDGYADLIVGTPADPGGPTGRGRVDVYFGGPGGVTAAAAPSQRLLAPPDVDAASFGISVAGAGDVNGDGFPDTIVGAHNSKACVYLGSPTGLGATPVIELQQAVVSGFGAPVAGVGDTDHDGYGDVVVSAPDAAVVTVYYGAAILAGAPLRLGQSRAAGSTAAYGTSVAGAGDVDGDRFADIVVGAPSRDVSGTGSVYVLHGSVTGPGAPVVQTIPLTVHASLGSTVAGVGDINGDGRADIAVGEPTASRVVFLAGPGGGAEALLGQITSPAMLSGSALAGAGDLDGNGYGDVVVGAPSPSGPTVVAVLGVAGVPWRPQVVTVTLATVPGRFGAAVAGAGDLDGDGFDDLVVSSSSLLSGASPGVYVFPSHGASVWHGATYSGTPVTLTPPSMLGGGFGRALAAGR